MSDVENYHGLCILIDPVSDSVLAPLSSPLTLKWLAKGRANAPRLVCERPEDEFDAGRCNCFRQWQRSRRVSARRRHVGVGPQRAIDERCVGS